MNRTEMAESREVGPTESASESESEEEESAEVAESREVGPTESASESEEEEEESAEVSESREVGPTESASESESEEEESAEVAESREVGPTESASESKEEEEEEECAEVAESREVGPTESASSSEEEVQEVKVSERERKKREKRKKKLMKEAKRAKNKGVCYISRVPPRMDPLKLRQLLSSFADILRIYLVPQDPEAQMRRKRAGGFRGQEFSEGWVEFADKRAAKRVANMLNGEPIGGKKRSQFFYDIWNIKYLSKFKWDDLTEEIAYRNAIREQKLQMELSAAKKERDFYLSKVERSRALSEIEQRMKKKRKVENEPEANFENTKLIRQFPQKQPLAVNVEKIKPKLSKDLLAEVFNNK